MSGTTADALTGADPSRFKIATSSAARIAAMTGLAADKLVGLSVSDVVKQFPHAVDPQIFFFRKICGSVVKTDPATGVDYPVPFATVQVEDTDCSFLGYFPLHLPWSWYFPFRCTREVIATTKTDACGNFCVWVPRWDIDWVVRFRTERKCYPIIFQRPTLRDIIRELNPQPLPPGPGPDPTTLTGIDRAQLVSRVAQSFGHDVALRISRLPANPGLGSSTVATDAALDSPALLPHIRPPLPAEIKALDVGGPAPAAAPALARAAAATISAATSAPALRTEVLRTDVHPAIATIANRLALNPDDLKAVDLRRYVGPFMRCFDIVFPEWAPILDIPDITFRVLQDTNGDGIEEQIYGESYFQVRWDAGNIGPVTLHAGPNALVSVLCGPTSIPCGNVPAIVMAGRLPVTGDPTVYDSANGFGVRTNRPHPSGLYIEPLPIPPGQAPLAGDLSLYGCAKTDPGATQYRLMFRYSADQGATFTAPTPFVNLTWQLFRLNGVGIGEWHTVSPDTQGWYPIALPAGPNAWQPEDLLLDWPSYDFADGLYKVTLQVGTGGAASSSSAEIAFAVDNSAPRGPITVETATSAAGPWTPIDNICPVVRRGVTPHDVFFRVTLAASAAHMRSVQLSGNGCGLGSFVFVSGSGGAQSAPGSTTYQHWHTDPTDNSPTLQVVYRLPAGAAEGTYSFGGEVSGRAFSPSGFDGGQLATPPWQYDPDYSHIYPSVAFSVFNSN